MEITYYVIRHKPSGGYLHTCRGHASSRFEPELIKQGGADIPRLCQSELSAKRVLSAWLMGRHRQDQDGYWDITPGAHRNIDDMEIVPVTLTLS